MDNRVLLRVMKMLGTRFCDGCKTVVTSTVPRLGDSRSLWVLTRVFTVARDTSGSGCNNSGFIKSGIVRTKGKVLKATNGR